MTAGSDEDLWEEEQAPASTPLEQGVLVVPRQEPPVLVVRDDAAGDPAVDQPADQVADPEQAIISFLKRLPDIQSVGLAHGPEGEIEQIRLLCSSNREPRHLAREVASLLRIWLYLSFPAEAVEVVQLLEQSEDEKGRIRLVGCEERPDGAEVEVEVTLLASDVEVRGVARGPRTSQAKVRLAAAATADAVNRRFETSGLCAAGWSDVVPGFNVPTAVAVMYFHGLPYAGASLVRDGRVAEAVVRAALSALNRQLAWPQR
ncbi:MAG: hypothetical protein M1602_03640 [Firmicutes bacterium]|nr:hypothetical protein [Bacillota bacterium]